MLLQAKETAKQLVRKDPSAANVAALHRVAAMLQEAERAMSDDEMPEVFKSAGEVLRYLQEETASRAFRQDQGNKGKKRGLRTLLE